MKRAKHAWDKFQNLLEGEIVHTNMPKNYFAEDFTFEALTPIFAISDAPIVRVVKGKLLTSETNMRMKRLKLYHFTYEIPDNEIIEVKPCGRCFAELITCY